MVQINFFNITIASAATASLIDMRNGRKLACVSLSLGTRNRYLLPEVSDTPNYFRYDKTACIWNSTPARKRESCCSAA